MRDRLSNYSKGDRIGATRDAASTIRSASYSSTCFGIGRWCRSPRRVSRPRRTSTYASWLNQVERFFALITQRAIRRGSFDSTADLVKELTTSSAPKMQIRAPSSGPLPLTPSSKNPRDFVSEFPGRNTSSVRDLIAAVMQRPTAYLAADARQRLRSGLELRIVVRLHLEKVGLVQRGIRALGFLTDRTRVGAKYGGMGPAPGATYVCINHILKVFSPFLLTNQPAQQSGGPASKIPLL